MIKLLIPFILLSLAALPVNQGRGYGIQTNNYFQIRDTLPSLDSFHDEDIDTIISSYKNQVFTIKLKKGNSYTYKTEFYINTMVITAAVKSPIYQICSPGYL